jgi:hypothetical protein
MRLGNQRTPEMRLGLLLGLLVAAIASPALAQPAQNADSDWPCAQRRTSTISPAAIWAGPDIAKAGAWDDDREAAELAQKLASRRTPMSDVDGLLDEFTAKAGAEKDLRLTRVFVGVLELINGERGRVVAGIVRYAQGQQKLAERVRQDGDAVADAREAEAEKPGPKEAEKAGTKESDPLFAQGGTDVENKLKWDKRIFEERSRSLTYVCETPTMLEQRAFELARRIQQRL